MADIVYCKACHDAGKGEAKYGGKDIVVYHDAAKNEYWCSRGHRWPDSEHEAKSLTKDKIKPKK